MSFTKCHEDLEIWKLSILLVKETYFISKAFPLEEKFVLSAQMRKAAISIPSNIAEGAGRKSNKEFIYFLSVSLGSLSELETQFVLSRELGYLKDFTDISTQIKRIRIMISSMIKELSLSDSS